MDQLWIVEDRKSSTELTSRDYSKINCVWILPLASSEDVLMCMALFVTMSVNSCP
ncbi:hypothetical protein SOVF_187720 [Spinacia oleracea]|nr:hypothetical protein SOVF_187720 [Spinacia oleracea]